MSKITAFCLCIILLVGLGSLCIMSDNYQIESWSRKNNVSFVKIERTILESSPFWKTKHTRIYKATTKEGKVHWFRLGHGLEHKD